MTDAQTGRTPTWRAVKRYLWMLGAIVPGMVGLAWLMVQLTGLQGDFNVIDLRLRADFGATSVTLFGSNLGDERGVTRTLPEANGLSQGLIRPRTFGVTLNWSL